MSSSAAPSFPPLIIPIHTTHRQSPARLLAHMGYEWMSTSLRHDCDCHPCFCRHRYRRQQFHLRPGIGSTRAKVLRSYITTAVDPDSWSDREKDIHIQLIDNGIDNTGARARSLPLPSLWFAGPHYLQGLVHSPVSGYHLRHCRIRAREVSSILGRTPRTSPSPGSRPSPRDALLCAAWTTCAHQRN